MLNWGKGREGKGREGYFLLFLAHVYIVSFSIGGFGFGGFGKKPSIRFSQRRGGYPSRVYLPSSGLGLEFELEREKNTRVRAMFRMGWKGNIACFFSQGSIFVWGSYDFQILACIVSVPLTQLKQIPLNHCCYPPPSPNLPRSHQPQHQAAISSTACTGPRYASRLRTSPDRSMLSWPRCRCRGRVGGR